MKYKLWSFSTFFTIFSTAVAKTQPFLEDDYNRVLQSTFPSCHPTRASDSLFQPRWALSFTTNWQLGKGQVDTACFVTAFQCQNLDMSSSGRVIDCP